MLLYDCLTAPSPRRARMFIAEKGLDVPLREVSLKDGEQRTPEYLKEVPTGTVPVLCTDDGQLISENVAIAAYLEALHPEPPLMGRTPLEKARVLEWDFRVTFGAFTACAEMLRNSSPRMVDRALPGPLDVAQIPELAERGRARIGQFWSEMDAHLAEHTYMAGESYTFADITATCAVDFSKWVKASPLEEWGNIAEWHGRMVQRANYGA